MHDVKHVDYGLVLEDLQQFCDLSRCIRAHTPLRLPDKSAELDESIVAHNLDQVELVLTVFRNDPVDV